jgi:N-acetyl-anhydromuramyl-L-alanine amidase AmpD
MYDVEVKDIMQANAPGRPKELKMGQRLLVPEAAPIRPIIPLYRSNKWKYIIVHHSATDEGSALQFYKFHCSRGWKNLGYHFVIDNGTEGKQDGQIEVSPRWINQQNGAHCQAGGMNYKGIGICLVGNFEEGRISEKQLDSLVYLVDILCDYYNIPVKNVIGHGQVTGAKTECPGKYFPWKEFRNRLK